MKRTLCITAAGLIIFGVCWYSWRQHPLNLFTAAVDDIGSHPETWLGEQVGISTYLTDQPLLFPISSTHVNEYCVAAYELLSRRLAPAPKTYYAEFASMPTQETIWQHPTFFVRLYVTSALEADGTAVGVFPGTYEQMRSGNLPEQGNDLAPDRFRPIAFAAPKRFLQAR